MRKGGGPPPFPPVKLAWSFLTFDETSEDLADVGLSGGELQSLLSDGWSARVIGGVTADFQGGSQFSMGAELGGLGGDLQSWKIRAGMDLPF